MDSKDNAHPIEDIFESEQKAIEAFASERPDVWQLTSTLGTAAKALLLTAAQIGNLTSPEHWRLLIWQNIYHYLFLSLRFIITRDLDSAYTLLRNATELTRDITCIKDDPEKAKLWVKSKFEDKRDFTFKFDDTDSQIAYVHQIYKVASNWGTHGHFSIITSGEFVEMADNSGEIAIYKISDEGANIALFMWLSAFCPIQLLCAEQFLKAHPAEFGPLGKWLLDLYEIVGQALKRL
jgi:hypothetical protein